MLVVASNAHEMCEMRVVGEKSEVSAILTLNLLSGGCLDAGSEFTVECLSRVC